MIPNHTVSLDTARPKMLGWRVNGGPVAAITYHIIEGEIDETSEQLDVDQRHIGFFQL